MKTRFPSAAVLFRFALVLTLATVATTAVAGVSIALDPDQTHTAYTSLSSYNPYASPHSIDLSAFLGADRFYNDGITGGGTIEANIEGGHIWNLHETLNHVTERYTPSGSAGLYDDHPTMIGLMMGGRTDNVTSGKPDSDCTGIAYGSDLRSGAFASSISGNSFSYNVTSLVHAYNHFFGTADVINSSFGSEDTTGTSDTTRIIDGFAFLNPETTMVCAAGNEGPSTNTVCGPASGYNSICVGAIGNANSYNIISSFSSRGLSDFLNLDTNTTVYNCRATVDICAPGEYIYGAVYDSSNTSVTDEYDYGHGTSYAAPIVAAGVALLNSASKAKGLPAAALDARVTKAVMMNSADKFASWNNQQQIVGGAIKTTQSLDATYGAGMMNLDKAYDQLLSGTTDVAGSGGGTIEEIGWDFGSLATVGSYNDYAFQAALLGGTDVTVTLSWFCDRTINVGAMTVSDYGFADLDIAIYDADDNLIATSASEYNNVEHLYFTLDETGEYYMRVLFDGMAYGNLFGDDVSYGLAWSATAVPEPGQLIMLLSLAVSMLVWRRVRR